MLLLHSAAVTPSRITKVSASEHFAGGMGPSDFGLGTELLDGIDDEAIFSFSSCRCVLGVGAQADR